MAYARRKSGSSRGRRRTKRGARRSSYSGRTRRYTKRTRRTSRPMSKKRILNTTSRKKRNGMLTFTNQQGSLVTIKQGPLILPGNPATGGVPNNIGYVMWRPTAMDLTSGSANNTIANSAQRTATTCFMRGLSEHIRIETNTGNPWFHRRICFTARDSSFYTLSASDTSGTDSNVIASGSVETSNGWQRLAANMISGGLAQTVLNQKGVIFKGAEGVDWDDVISAPIDTARVDLKFDKTWVYRSGNASGTLKEHKLWHPMNKNLVYDDDETGAAMAENNVSVEDKRGMGNYHVLDLFSQGSSGSTSDLLSFRCNSTLYWHEK
uniref:Capsid protein n=1 Tax=Emberiza spodocephala Genomoviridae sp. TaxID=2814950 RepID=A0A8A4XD35_9VIRU|nr:MAG: capsid protein [Gemycircularvirus]